MKLLHLIKKGHHHSGLFYSGILPCFPRITKSIYNGFKFKFDKSCLFEVKDADDYDINKLFGFSFGWHHKNSIRLGWRPSALNEKKIQLFAYWYNHSIRSSGFICEIDADVIYRANINCYFQNNTIRISIVQENNTHLIGSFAIQKFDFPKIRLGYYLFPYFGGNKEAPHDMKIHIWKSIFNAKKNNNYLGNLFNRILRTSFQTTEI